MTLHLTSCRYADRPMATPSELLELARRMEREHSAPGMDVQAEHEYALCIDALRRAARA